MADTTSQPSRGREPIHALNVEDLLISRDEAWEQAPAPKFADACDSLLVYGVYLNTGDTASIPVRCHSWDHRRCAEQHALRELRELQRVFGASGGAYYAKVPIDDFVSARLCDRRYELAKTEGVVWYRWYRRDDGTVWVIASHPLGGRKPPAEFRRTDSPLKVAAVALRQPGVKRADGSNLARVPSAESGIDETDDEDETDSGDPHVEEDAVEEDAVEVDEGSQVEWIGTANEERWEATQRAAAVEAMDRYGVEVDPRHAVTLGGGITPEEWAECLKAVRHRKE
jgi:hypothetical protein